jgi:ABC-type antimicrobial peptide transport system permease subunit
MNRNFFKIALRYLWRNRTFSLLNLACLTFGLTCTTLAVLFIFNVLNYDKFHKNYNRICAVESYVTYFNGDKFPKQYLSASLNDAIKQQVPEIEELTRVVNRSYIFADKEISFTENGIYADNNFFSVFTFPLLQGSTNEMTTDINTIMITERMALKFFKTTDCIGKTLLMKDENRQESFKITGILKNIPSQSWLQFDYVIPFSNFLANNSWANDQGASSNQIWALLKNNVDRGFVEGKIKNLIKNQEANLNQELFLFPLKEKMLYRYSNGRRVWDEMQNLVIVGTVALAILLIACFNFINLAIALNIKRYREAGIKKVVGSSKMGIINQFLGETFILTFTGLVAAIVVSQLLIGGFNTLFHQEIHFSLSNVTVITILLAITLLTGFLSGVFPSLYLASSSPLNVLKGRIATSNSYSLFRQGLIVFQFTIPIVLIICMMIVRTQDKFMRNFDSGVEKDKVIVLDNSENSMHHSESIKADLLAIPGIDAVSFTSCIPTRGSRPINDVDWEGKQANEKLHFWCINTDFDYNKTVKIKITDGRYFDKSFSSDSACYLINDVAAKVMKYNNAVGSSFTVEGKKGTIIGVFSDFHAIDLAGPIVPTIIRIKPSDAQTLLVKFSSGSYPDLTNKISKIFKHYDPEASFQPRLFRDISEFSELNVPAKLIGIAFFISLVLACLGFFGIASFTAESRTKEIGIRKTNGATTRSVMQLLLANYSKWLTIAFLLSLPFSFFLGKMFLGRFYFHTAMPYWAFIAGPLIAYLIALSTVWIQSWRAATRNPVETLRYE